MRSTSSTSAGTRVRALALAGAVAGAGCQAERPKPAPTKVAAEPEQPIPEPAPEPAPEPKPARARFDVHVHLVSDAVDPLLATLDRAGIQRAVVLASPHLDPAHLPDQSERFADWRGANDRLLELSAGHRDRLVPFITADPAEARPEELRAWFDAGACGVKLYMGHRSFHARPLADEAHRPMFSTLERERVPVLLHINTFRFEAELGELLASYPELNLLCPHFCGSRTDVERLERILAAHPGLLVDTSHGPGKPGVQGFTALELERERVRALILAEPERFLFGSDLVTSMVEQREDIARFEWDRQVQANLGLLEADRFEFNRLVGEHGVMEWSEYRGLALDDATLGPVLAGNAERWLASCLDE
ncbi:amidohydrolase family protein [Plesiocystis pacifica]|uniref:amidohydrolase family protein n=1 Tax=Plesiocystis pacifica TaxID=191768 RepID=UPI000A305F1F|nr:amidohydrolase family protein [Plesiocystis pacifica]